MHEDQLKVNEFKAYKLPTDLVINIIVPEGSSSSDPTEELGCIDNIAMLNTEKGVELNILFNKQSEDKKIGPISVTDQTTVTNILLSDLGDSVFQQETRLKVQQSGKHTLSSVFQLTNDKQPMSTSRILPPNSPKAGAYVSEDFREESPRSFCRYPYMYGDPLSTILGLEGVDYLMGLHDIRYLGNAFTSASDIPAAGALLFECLNNNNKPVKLLDQQHRLLTVFSVHTTLPFMLIGEPTQYTLLCDTTTTPTNTAWYLIEHSTRELTEEDTFKYSEMVEAFEEERQRHLKVIEYYKEEQRRKKEEIENSLLANK